MTLRHLIQFGHKNDLVYSLVCYRKTIYKIYKIKKISVHNYFISLGRDIENIGKKPLCRIFFF